MPQNNSVQVFEGGWKQLENAIFTDNQGSVPTSGTLTFTMKPDGSELYVLAGVDVETYPLTIPYDPNTIGDRIRLFTVTDDANPLGINFQDDGTQMFIGGADSTVMLAYTLPVPFDTSSIVASPVSVSLTAIAGDLRNFVFSRDGDFFFTTSSGPTIIHSFPLSTNWDITTIGTVTTFDPEIGTVLGIDFKPEGDKMYLVDIIADFLVEYDLSTINDITTAAANGNILDYSPTNFLDVNFRSTGKQLLFNESNGDFTRFHLDEQWNVSTASLFTNTLDTVDYQSIFWKPNGERFFAVNTSAADRIDSYNVSERWNISTALIDVNSFALAGIADAPRGLWVAPDGLTCFVTDAISDEIVQLNMTAVWDISTMSAPGISFDLNALAGINFPNGIVFSSDQLTYYVVDGGTDDVFQFSVSTPLAILTTVDTTNTLDLSSFGDLTDIRLKTDDSLMYITENVDERILLFSLPPDGNVSEAVFLQEVSVTSLESNLRGLYVKQPDGKQIWISGQASGNIICLDMTLEFNNSIITSFGEELTDDTGATLVYV